MKPTIANILSAWLTANGYGGLYRDECGCRTDALCPCGDPCLDCTAGIVTPCDGECDEPRFCIGHVVPRPGDET